MVQSTGLLCLWQTAFVSVILLHTTERVYAKNTNPGWVAIDPPCAANDALDYLGQKTFGHYRLCTERALAKEVPYFYAPPPGTSADLPNWVNCSKFIPADMLVAHPSQIMDSSGSPFKMTANDRDWALSKATESQRQTFKSYWNLNRGRGPACDRAMQKHWCLYAMGVADKNDQNKYGIYSCRSHCEHLWEVCDAYGANSTYDDDGFSGCLTPTVMKESGMDAWYVEGHPVQACYNDNFTITMPDCEKTLGFKCLNGGTWHGQCMGCMCPPGFGGYNCGRCSTTGRSIPSAYYSPIPGNKTGDMKVRANQACVSITAGSGASSATCLEYTTYGNSLVPNDAVAAPVYECELSLETKYPDSMLAGGYLTMQMDIRERDLRAKQGTLSFAMFVPLEVWEVGYESYKVVQCNGTNCTQAPWSECQKNGVPVEEGSSCYVCEYAGCGCFPNGVTNEDQAPGVKRCAFFDKPIDYNKPPINAHFGCNNITCYIYANNLLPVNPLILQNCQTSTCHPLVPSSLAGVGPIWIIFYILSAGTAVLITLMAIMSTPRKSTCCCCSCKRALSSLSAEQKQEKTSLLSSANDSVQFHPDMKLSFHNIEYSPSKTGRTLLSHVSGTVSTADGGVYAIMGPSGAGKTTLLDVLAGRKAGGKSRGTLTVDGARYATMASRRCAFGYVVQDDSTLPIFLTVREAIQFSANLRLPPSMSTEERNRRVDRVIGQLGLEKVKDSIIGDIGSSGISGGERRRVSIGMELVVEPQVLLLDEPTSGLDSAAAMKVVDILTQLTMRGECLVVCTIHQPRPDVFSSFGRILLLSEGGVVYEGAPTRINMHFERFGHKCPTHVNIADFALDHVRTIPKVALGDTYSDQTFPLDSPSEIIFAPDHRLGPKLSCCRQVWLLFLHYSRELFRSPSLLWLQYITPLLVGGAFGFIYADIPNDISGVQNRAGAFFAMQVFWCLVSMSALDTWNAHQAAVSRDIASGYYSILPYFVSNASGEVILLRFLPPIAFAGPFYYLAHRNQVETLSMEHFAIFASILVFVSLSFSALCLVIGAAVRNVRAANAIAVLIMVMSLLFGGLLVNRNDAADYYSFMFYVFPLGYAFEAIMANELSMQVITFDPKGIPMGINTDGTVWLTNLGLYNRVPFDMLVLTAFVCGALFLAYCLLHLRHRTGTPTSAPNAVMAKNTPKAGDVELFRSKTNLEEAVGMEAVGAFEETAATDNPQEVHTLSFYNIEYSPSKTGRTLLSHVSGTVSTADGGVYAIMGPSGAGKTTLLDVLAGRKAGGKSRGTLTVDGARYATMASRRCAFGYVVQDDSTLPIFLTVREAIQFSANLRLPPSMSTEERNRRVDRVIGQLGLEKVKDSIIGDIGSSGISGGERRRVSIGMELVVEPQVLLLDEPTSGLDSAAAMKVVDILTQLTMRGECLVVCTIHQPRPDVFSSFGRILLLSEGGVVYEGAPLEVIDALTNIGRQCPDHVNVADFALDVLPTLTATERMFLAQEEVIEVPDAVHLAVAELGGKGASCMRAFCVLCAAEMKRVCRFPSLFLVHAGLSVFMALVLGGVYYGMQADLKGTLNRLFSLFTMVTFVALLGMSAVSLFQGHEKIRFLRERASGYYSTFPFTLSKVVFDDMLFRLIPCVVFTVIVYNLVDYRRVWTEHDFYNATSGLMKPGSLCAKAGLPFQRAGICVEKLTESVIARGVTIEELMQSMAFFRSAPVMGLILFLTSTIASSLCATVGVITTTNRTGSFVAVLIILLFTMFNGALINNNLLQSGGSYSAWLRYVSPFGFAMEGLLIGQMEGQCFFFDPKTSGSSISGGGDSGGGATALACAEVYGQTWLLNLGCSPAGETSDGTCRFTGDTIVKDIVILCVIRVFLFFVLHFALYFKRNH